VHPSRAGGQPGGDEAVTDELEAFAMCVNTLFWPGLASLVAGWLRGR
jgi:hypothetical protein